MNVSFFVIRVFVVFRKEPLKPIFLYQFIKKGRETDYEFESYHTSIIDCRSWIG